jgi:Delta3-Delta2-enoyl-CoA isomerase
MEGDVAVLTWNDGENRVNLDSLAALNAHLDELDAVTGPLAIVLTGSGKFFSNGFDLDRFGSNPEEFNATVAEFQRTVGRLLLFPALTVAALNGHTFAAGAMLSCGFDYRIMRDDRGYWCMNEVEIGVALNETLWSIMHHRLPKGTAVLSATTGKRFSGPEALAAGIVEAVAPEDRVLADAVEMAARYVGLNRKVMATHKRLIHGDEAAYLGFNR